MKRTTANKNIAYFILAFYPVLVLAHGDVIHEKKVEKTIVVKETGSMKKLTYKKINKTYLSDIKPIFEKKCFDCHAELKKKPWYYKVPGVKPMIDKDISEAKEHIDMRQDFPFVSHESPLDDLKSIKKIGLEGGMPPLRYILAHWDSRLTDAEKKKLVNWATQSIKLLKTETAEK